MPRSADAVIADPPYMINTKSDGTGNIQPWADYMNASLWYAEMLRAIRRSVREGGCAWVFTNWRSMATMTKASCDARWPIASCMVWNKDSLGTGNHLRHSYELVLLFATEGFELASRSIADVQKFNPVPPARRVHSAQKPVDLLKLIIGSSVPDGGTVIDPFMGSGSTGVACAETGRSFVGIEMTEHYYDVARARIAEAYARG